MRPVAPKLRAGGPDSAPWSVGVPILSSPVSLAAAGWRALSRHPLVLIVALGGLVRLIAAIRLSPHVDEAASLLAARMTAERGVPILPSGTVYLQGATLSYLTAPFVWLGFDDLSVLTWLRLPVVLIGSLAIPLAYKLGTVATGRERIGLAAALFVALDPLAVQWSGHLRMYGLLQPLTLGLALCLVLALRSPGSRWPLRGAVAVLWLAVFTHSGAALLLAPILLAAVMAMRSHRGPTAVRWGAALGASAVAPVALVGFNRLLGDASVSGGGESGGSVGFVGDHLLGMRWVTTLRTGVPSGFDAAVLIPSVSTLSWLLPMALVGVGSAVAARRWWRGSLSADARIAVPILLATFWVPTAAVWIAAVEPRARYHVHSLMVGYVLVAIVGGLPRGLSGSIARRPHPMLPAAAVLVLTVALGWRLSHPTVHPDYRAATSFVATARQADDPVVAALPAGVFLELGDDAPVLFLAGPADRPRAERLTRTTTSGDVTDYWVGVPAITSAAELSTFLAAHPDAWIIVDQERLAADWAYAGPIADVIAAGTVQVHTERGGVMVLRPRPLSVATLHAPSGHGDPRSFRD